MRCPSSASISGGERRQRRERLQPVLLVVHGIEERLVEPAAPLSSLDAQLGLVNFRVELAQR